MKIFATASLTLAAAIGLSACSQKAQNDTAAASNTIAADANATMSNAIDDVSAASDRALGSAEATMDNVSDRASDRISADNTEASIRAGADRAADATGNAMVKAGNALKE